METKMSFLANVLDDVEAVPKGDVEAVVEEWYEFTAPLMRRISERFDRIEALAKEVSENN